MRHPIFSVTIGSASLTTVRERTRQVAELFGLEALQRTQLVTAVSEIARNTAQYAGEGTLAFMLDTDSAHCRCQTLVAEVSDHGPGIPNARDVVQGLREGQVQKAVSGIAGARRLVSYLTVTAPEAGGTIVTLEMALSGDRPRLAPHEIDSAVAELLRRKPRSPIEELEQQNRDMLLALEDLRRKQLVLQQNDLRRNESLAMLAHELRNPLATMNMTLAILKRKAQVTPQELAQRCDVMGRQVDQLVRMVDDLTDVTRVREGKVELLEAPVEVNALVKDALEMSGAAIEQRRHAVAFTPTPMDLWVQGDAARLLQVVGNVIQNAAKYTPAEGRIEARIRVEGESAVIEVADNGAGIAAEMLPQVFGMFVQARNRSTDANAGLGVGLTLADRLVRDHGGSIAVKSEGLGRGSQFTITLPLMRGAAEASSTPAAA